MRRLFLSLLSFGFLLTANAQRPSARQEIHDDILLTGSNYLAYVDPTQDLTPAPKGYEPFYLTHYGRHGSRWLCSDSEYKRVVDALQRAHDAGKLTQKGEELKAIIDTFYYKTAIKRAGELTTVGEQQHHRIGRRMTEHFPEIFSAKNCRVDARSTVVIRCILSMEAECEELTAYNPHINMHNDVSESFQYYLNADWEKRISEANNEKWKQVFDYQSKYLNPERFYNSIFNDPSYRDEKINSRTKMMRRIFDIACNMQSHYGSKAYPVSDLDRVRQNLPAQFNSYSLYDFFTEDELFNIWRCNNIEWYVNYSSEVSPYTQRNLLVNFLETSDTVLNVKDFHGATLRFGHEVCVMPMASLLELGDSYPRIPMAGLDTLENVWRNYDIFPMASNMQLIFYRPKKGKDGDILVKALLNEREVRLPAQTDNYPYYRWADLKKYYWEKVNAWDGK